MSPLKNVPTFYLVFLLFVISGVVGSVLGYFLGNLLGMQNEIVSLLLTAISTFVAVYAAVKFIEKKYLLTDGNVRKVTYWFIGIRFIAGLIGVFTSGMFIAVFSINDAQNTIDPSAFTTNPLVLSSLLNFAMTMLVSYIAVKVLLRPNANNSTKL